MTRTTQQLAAERAKDRQLEQELRPLVPRDRPTDTFGRQIPRQLGASTFLRAIPGLAAQFKKEVPASHFENEKVGCPCGGETELGRGITSCRGGCNRYFLHIGHGRVVVAGPYADDDEDQAAAA